VAGLDPATHVHWAGLDPAIHVFPYRVGNKDVDALNKSGQRGFYSATEDGGRDSIAS
jgi:hypothetical protein